MNVSSFKSYFINCLSVKWLYLTSIVLFLSSFSKPLVETGKDRCKKNKDFFSLNEAIKEVESSTITDSIYLACLCHQIGVAYYNTNEYISALMYYEKAIKIREQINDGLLWRTHHNIALTYHELDNYYKAIHHNQSAYVIPGIKKSKDSLNIFRFLSEDFSATGDIKQALEYGKMAIKVNADTLRITKAMNALGLILVNANDTAKAKLALSNFNNALKLKNGANQFDEEWIYIKINKGVALGVLNKNDDALQQYNLALSLLSKENTFLKASILNNIGAELIDQKKYNTALKKIKASLNLKRQYFSDEPFVYEYAANYENIADIHFKMNDYETALQNYQTAIINLTNSFRNTDVFQNPVLKNDLYVYSNLILIRVLDAKAKTAFAFYQKNKEEAYLQLAHQTYHTLLDFHNQLQHEIRTENSRLFQAKNMIPYIENALAVAYELQDKEAAIAESAFRLMEKNKATVLLQLMNESQALQFANIPNTLLEREGELKTAINFYKKQLNDAKVYEEPENIERFEKLLFNEENKHRQLIKNLENNYPNYHQLKYKQNETQLKEAQNYLRKEDALLEYFIGERSIYVLSIQKEQSKLYQFQKLENWNALINNFSSTLLDVDAIQNQSEAVYNLFTKEAHNLYNILLKTILTDLKPTVKHLKIIPDAELNYIPFDVLLSSLPSGEAIDYANLNYLLKQQTISYAYSAALLLESNRRPKRSNQKKYLGKYAGFAPIYRNGNSPNEVDIVMRKNLYTDLPYARKSVAQIAQLIAGDNFLADKATRQEFIEKAPQYNILHLAMHGFLNDKNPLYSSLAFTATTESSGDLLHAADLYNLELNADLVVLSACNTGSGKLQKGEGVMSLSRAFTYAGSKSMVMSLWEVPDKSTAVLMKTFFTKLKNGFSKDEALQTTKLDFIKNHPTRAHPLYWAGFIPSGNMKAIDFENSYRNWQNWILIVATILLAGTITFLLLKKKL